MKIPIEPVHRSCYPWAMRKNASIVLAGLSCLFLPLLAGCGSGKFRRADVLNQAHFWQRANVTEAAWMEGPKAQQLLHRDITRCVSDLQEEERLEGVRRVTPAETLITGNIPVPGTPADDLAAADTPDRNGYLRAEDNDYHDFEACMVAKGWERLENVPYDVAARSRDTYTETILKQKRRTRSGERRATPRNDGPWDGLNR